MDTMAILVATTTESIVTGIGVIMDQGVAPVIGDDKKAEEQLLTRGGFAPA